MVRTQCRLLHRQRALVELLGGGVLPLLAVRVAQVVEHVGNSGRIGPKPVLAHRERLFIELLGVGVLALLLIHDGEVVERTGQSVMAGAERLFLYRQRACVELLGICLALDRCWRDY